ncbi:hypothetical protein CAPTEDRAFT_201348 [Capitella teleta]|uniref:THAP-type domain-containing protein n=1 Tax=Capitella teleta TaxID=283909 RepID=R7UGL3_CAPTE|nr:hypothetical protein CAPTEDRAFT_201348 [Capitella teleta]|eukprot:ELU05365.1 hypothetical protein CAPTEDRAFT_201348 [Capitella teleta]
MASHYDYGHSLTQSAKRDDWDPSKFSVLCSVHFKEDDFPLKYRLQCYTDIAGVKGRRLLPEAVPTIHVTQDDVESSPTIMNQFEDSGKVEEPRAVTPILPVEEEKEAEPPLLPSPGPLAFLPTLIDKFLGFFTLLATMNSCTHRLALL